MFLPCLFRVNEIRFPVKRDDRIETPSGPVVLMSWIASPYPSQEKGNADEHNQTNHPRPIGLLSHDTILSEGCALRRGQEHRTHLGQVAFQRFAMVHDDKSWTIFFAIHRDRIFGGTHAHRSSLASTVC